MSSFVDAHTPSESPDASSSESSTGGDWESGEFSKTNENVVWPKQRRVICSKRNFLADKSNFTASTSTNTTTLSTIATTAAPSAAKLSQNHFKSKTNNIKTANNNNHNKDAMKKMRWLSNMRSDPDFRETFIKSVIIQPRQSFDSLDIDFPSPTKVDTLRSSKATNKTQNNLNNNAMLANPNDTINLNQTLIDASHETHLVDDTSIAPVDSLESHQSAFGANDEVDYCNSSLCLNSHADTESHSINEEPMRSIESKYSALDDAQNFKVCCSNVSKTTNSSSTIPAASSSLAFVDIPSNSSEQILSVSTTKNVESSQNKRLPTIKTKTKIEKGCQAQRVNLDADNGMSTPAFDSPSSLINITKRNSRYTPFTFREIRNELRAVMRQNSNQKYS